MRWQTAICFRVTMARHSKWRVTPDKKLALVTGRAYPEQAQETAKYLGTDVLETTAYVELVEILHFLNAWLLAFDDDFTRCPTGLAPLKSQELL